jgi:hypothetical protein
MHSSGQNYAVKQENLRYYYKKRQRIIPLPFAFMRIIYRLVRALNVAVGVVDIIFL